MFPESKDHISLEGVGAALMAWNRMPLNWSNIIYNNIKLELLKKKPRGVLFLYSAVYLTKLMDPIQPAVPSPPTANSAVLTYIEIGSTSEEPAAKKMKKFSSSETQEFAVCMRTQNPSIGPSTFTLDQLASHEVIVLGDTIEETISAIQNTVHQKNGEYINKESAIYQAMELSACQIEKLITGRKTMEEEKVKLTADVQRNKRAILAMTLELEGMKEELQTYRQLPTNLAQSQIDHNQLKEDFQKLKGEYQQANDSLVYYSGLRKDLNQNYFKIHKENEELKNQIENLRVQLHAAVDGQSSNRQDLAAELKQKEQEVILITSERDGLQGMIANATQHMASQLDQFRALAWDQELKFPPSFSLFRAYELQRDVLLRTLDLPSYSQLDSSLFDLVWKITKPQANQHNLVCEMIARGDFVLMDPEKLILPIGNLGARVTMYYINLEE
jgi:predicted  nucleic acid-binding Zn-ribbon protein